ncbi:hypothetical protein [Nocardia spumae]|uniref:hypothetical protein n=1 Tax=Nocardia spumae TaxID=2887190 RepID=UPI001D143296|nr:hypothetical protein [Nocardia spumae]
MSAGPDDARGTGSPGPRAAPPSATSDTDSAAAVQNSRSIDPPERFAADPVGGAGRRAPRRISRVLGAVVVVVAAIGAIAWWSWPARDSTVVLHGGTLTHQVTVTLGHRAGASDIDIELSDRAGNPVPRAMIRVQSVEPRMGFAGEPVPAADTGSGRYHAANVAFMTTGPWQLRLSITTGDGVENLSLPLWIGG